MARSLGFWPVTWWENWLFEYVGSKRYATTQKVLCSPRRRISSQKSPTPLIDSIKLRIQLAQSSGSVYFSFQLQLNVLAWDFLCVWLIYRSHSICWWASEIFWLCWSDSRLTRRQNKLITRQDRSPIMIRWKLKHGRIESKASKLLLASEWRINISDWGVEKKVFQALPKLFTSTLLRNLIKNPHHFACAAKNLGKSMEKLFSFTSRRWREHDMLKLISSILTLRETIASAFFHHRHSPMPFRSVRLKTSSRKFMLNHALRSVARNT